jgi:hypothetical protein
MVRFINIQKSEYCGKRLLIRFLVEHDRLVKKKNERNSDK